MSCIEISNLTTASSESLAGADSFLNELEKAKTTQIFGGWRGGWSKSWSKKGKGDQWKKDECWYEKKEKCDDGDKKKSDYSYYYKEKHYSGWKKDC